MKAAIASVFIGAAWQHCRVHFMRDVLAVVPKNNAEMVAAAIRTIFAQPDAEHTGEQLEVIAMMLGTQLPKVEHMLCEAREDLLAFAGFPSSHWKRIWSTKHGLHPHGRNRGKASVRWARRRGGTTTVALVRAS